MKHIALSSVLFVSLLAASLSAAPAPVKEYPPYGQVADVVNSASGLAFRGDDVLLATTGSSAAPRKGEKERALVAYSLMVPDKPVVVGRLALDGAPFPQGIAVAGDIAFVVDGLHLWCVDAKDPAKMSVVSKTRFLFTS